MADQVKVEVKAKGPPKFAMKGVQVRKATADEKTAAAATETATDVIAGLVQAPRVASAKAAAVAAAAAAPSMVASVFAAKPKKVIAPSASASAPAPKVQAVQVKPKGQSVLPVTLVAAKAKEESESKEVSEESEKERSEESESEVKPVTENDILIEIGHALDDLKDEEQTYRDLPTEIIGDLTFFEFPLDFTDDELKILDSKFKTLKFTSKGFSGDDGPDFDTDMELLTEMIKRSVLESEKEKEKEKEKAVPIKKKIDTVLNAKFVPFSEAIVKEEKEDHYLINPAPDAWMPTSRRAFSDYIEKTFEKFIIPPPQGPPDFEACAKQGAAGAQKAETYIYQQFIREYMRQETPYRGILVYHGLGSGKTCSAIATAEALFGTVNKKIVVMTPLSLRKNFLNEIMFCGFQHFRLQNYWVPFERSEPTLDLFAKEVLGIPDTYKAGQIWIADFTKADTPNYKSLGPKEQTQIRDQIMAILNNRITFINYNGVTASKLKEFACAKPDERPFDNAVIVIDEVHNLIRLMQGIIDPYLTKLPGHKRKISPEPITGDRWIPTLCGKAANYRRGYLFYRLLIEARNCKIVALSGTPLINFPEEIAILANVLHGYIPVGEGKVLSGNQGDIPKIQAVMDENPYIDFTRVTPTSSGIHLTFTQLPEGVKKVFKEGKMKGVQRVQEKTPTIQELGEILKKELMDKKQLRVDKTFTYKAESLLPPFGQVFRDIFTVGAKLKNEVVLSKRLTGLISYYKGSKEELMPKVTRDEVVRVPLSLYAASEYLKVRLDEVKKEEKKKKQKKSSDPVWAEVYEIAAMQQSSNYRMASRQMCNFAFPEEIERPRPRDERERTEEAGRDPTLLIDAALETSAGEGISLQEEKDDLAAEAALAEDRKIVKAERDAFKKEKDKGALSSVAEAEEDEDEEDEDEDTTAAKKGQKGGVGSSDEEEDEEDEEDEEEEEEEEENENEDENEEEEEVKPALGAPKPSVAAVAAVTSSQKPVKIQGKKLTIEEQRARDLADCKAGLKAGETYINAVARAKRCLKQFTKKKLLLEGPEPNLATYSPKFAAILKNIIEAPGSSLVYSQFLQMEGIGIFSIVMDVNGFVPIEIEFGGEGPRFSEKTRLSLEKGPDANINRYITFSGGEPDEVRRYALNIFNAKFSELPVGLGKILEDAKFTDNKRGQLCRVFCITSAGAEGLSLKNVRRVHIMEPYWNDVRLAQVKGRAVRICSHIELPYSDDPAQNQRTVEVFTYVSVFSPEQMKAKEGDLKIDESIANKDGMDPGLMEGLYEQELDPDLKLYIMTSDERLYYVSQMKRTILSSIQEIMKASAVDCRLNTYDNDEGLECYSLKGNVGDFMYHPNLEKDLLESASAFDQGQVAEDKKVEPVTDQALELTYGPEKRKLLVVSVKDPATLIVLSYDVYDGADKKRTKKIGTMKANGDTGLPKGKVKFL